MAYYKSGGINVTSNSNVSINTASGPIASFNTNLSMPVLETKATINPVQDLHGEDKPYPAGGGVNIWDEEWENGSINTSTGVKSVSNDTIRPKNNIKVISGVRYNFTKSTGKQAFLLFYDINDNVLQYSIVSGDTAAVYNKAALIASSASNRTFTPPENTAYMLFRHDDTPTYNNDISINYPATDTAYHPYENICPISGHSSVNIIRCGVNLFDVDKWLTSLNVPYTKTGDTYSLTTSSTIYNNSFVISKTDIPITLSVNSITGTATNVRLQILNSRNTVVESCYANETKTATGCKVRINYSTSGTAEIEKPQIVLGSTPVEYAAYNGQTYTIAFGQTVYGGVLDVTRGKLTVTHFGEVFDGSNDENWDLQSINSYNIANFYIRLNKAWTAAEVSICDRFTVQTTLIAVTTTEGYLLSRPDTFYLRVNSSRASTTAELKTWLASNNFNVVYPLATPFDIDLTPVQINALLGVNNVWHDDNGDTEVKYRKVNT